MERSPVITLLFKVRIITLLALLSIADGFAIWYAYERTMAKGATVQLVFGFEYAILLTIAASAFVKFVFHSIDLRSEDPWENKSM
jgi:E3 ubiquitin-protein ligase synoviolin